MNEIFYGILVLVFFVIALFLYMVLPSNGPMYFARFVIITDKFCTDTKYFFEIENKESEESEERKQIITVKKEQYELFEIFDNVMVMQLIYGIKIEKIHNEKIEYCCFWERKKE